MGGVVYYDQVHNKKTPGALEAMSPEWWDMLIFSAREAERLGLTFECHVSNGYVAGGPWVTPDMGMQMLTSVSYTHLYIEVVGLQNIALAVYDDDG